MKLFVRLLVSLGLSVGFLYLAFRNVRFDEIWEQIRSVEPKYVAWFVISLVVIQLCRVFRWDILIRPFAPIPPRTLLRVSSLGLFLILALPLRLGELARPYLLKRETGASMTAGIAAVGVERTIDGLLVTLLFFLTTLDLDTRYAGAFTVPDGLWAAAFISLGVFGAATIVIVGTLVARGPFSRLLHRLGDPISPKLTTKAVTMLESFVSGLRALPNARAILLFVAITLVYWAANGLGLYWLMLGFGWELPPIAGFVLVCVIVLGIMIPAGPGNLGTFQTAILVGLSVFGVSETDAAAYGLVVWPLTLGVVSAFGVPYLFSPHVRLGRIVRASEEAEPV